VKRFLCVVAGGLGLLVLGSALVSLGWAWSELEPDTVVGPFFQELEARSGARIEWDSAQLAVGLRPSLRVEDVRVEGVRIDDAALVSALVGDWGRSVELWRGRESPLANAPANVPSAELRLRIDAFELGLSWISLLRGSPAVRTLQVNGGRLTVARSAAGPAGDRSTESQESRDPATGSQGWVIDGIEAAFVGKLDGRARIDWSAELPGVGRLRSGWVELEGLGAPGPSRVGWAAELQLGGFDLAELRSRLSPELALWGSLDARLQLAGTGGSLDRVGLQGKLASLDLRVADLRVLGPADVAADWSARPGEELAPTAEVVSEKVRRNRWRLDLSGCEIVAGSLVRKPAGVEAELAGTLAGLETAFGEQAFELRSGASELRGRFALRGSYADGRVLEGSEASIRSHENGSDENASDENPRVEGFPGRLQPRVSLRGAGRVDARDLAGWLPGDLAPSAGELELSGFGYESGSGADVEAEARALEFEVPDLPPVRISGPLRLVDSQLSGRDLRLEWAEQVAFADTAYDLERDRLELQLSLDGVDLARISTSFLGEPHMGGRLYAQLRLDGSARADRIRGVGRFEVPGGELARASLRELAADLDPQETRAPEPFSRLSGEFTFADGVARFRAVELEQGRAEARVAGKLTFRDRSVELSGSLTFEQDAQVVERAMRVSGVLGALRTTLGEEAPQSPPRLGPYDPAASVGDLAGLELPEPGRSDPPDLEIRRLQRERLSEQLYEIERARASAEP